MNGIIKVNEKEFIFRLVNETL